MKDTELLDWMNWKRTFDKVFKFITTDLSTSLITTRISSEHNDKLITVEIGSLLVFLFVRPWSGPLFVIAKRYSEPVSSAAGFAGTLNAQHLRMRLGLSSSTTCVCSCPVLRPPKSGRRPSSLIKPQCTDRGAWAA